MNAATLVLWAAAAILFVATPLACAVISWRDRMARREDARRRTEQGRDVDGLWIASLADERPALPQRRPSDLSSAVPIYDAVSREFAERELTDERLAEQMERWS